MGSTESQIKTETKLRRIAWLSGRDPGKEFSSLMHLFNEESLVECFNQLNGKKAVGIDGTNKEHYGDDLTTNLQNLLARMKELSYRPGPAKEILIPKEGRPGETRPLAISNFEDKLIQKMFQRTLESIYDPIFKDVSFGFRPGLGCHDAIRALAQHLYQNPTETVLDLDLKNFFGSIDHKNLNEILSKKIKDKTFLRYIGRMLKAGALSSEGLKISEEGVPQGNICGPVLANIFAHEVIDEWFEGIVKKHCKGKVAMFRYCDDAVICCENNYDAMRIRKALVNRLNKFKLSLNEEKTKLVPFSRGTIGTSFDFLGFTFYWGKSRNGFSIPKLKTAGKRLRGKLKRVKEWAKSVRGKSKLPEIWRTFCSKVQGHINYYGVSHNSRNVDRFVTQALKIFFKWINRRGQRKTFTWNEFWNYVNNNSLPKVKVYHRLF